MIFSRLRTLNQLPGARFFLRHSSTPGIRLGRYESGLEAVWAWDQLAHLLVVERSSYGAGENLVRLLARLHDGERVQLDPKGGRTSRHQPWMFMTVAECATQVERLKVMARERADRVAQGETVTPLLVTIPELHDILEAATWPPAYEESEAGRALLFGILHLLKIARAGRIHVLANLRQGYFYKAHLPAGLLELFSGLLVLGKTDRISTERLGLPHVFDSPHGRLGDLGDGFWPLEVRRK